MPLLDRLRSPGQLPWTLLGCIALLFGFAMLPITWLAPAMYIDDALYYPRVAAHIVAGHGPTYDMRTFTNGFHPLWGVVLIPAAWLAGGDHMLLARLATLLCAGFATVAAVSLHDLGKRMQWGALGLGVAVALIVIPRADLWLGLMESALSLGLLTTLLACAVRHDWLVTRSPWQLAGFGALVAATFLSRLDFLFIVAALGGWAVWQRQRLGHRLAWLCRDLGIVGAVALLPVLPYLIANHHFFGSIVPVSGRRKTTGLPSLEQFQQAALFPAHAIAAKLHLPVAAVLTGAALLVLATVTVLRRRPVLVADPPHWDRYGVVAALLAGTALRWLYHRLFMFQEAGYTPWYWVPEYLCVAILLGWTAAQVQVRFRSLLAPSPLRRIVAACAVVLLGVTFVYRDGQRDRANNVAAFDNALWARDHLAADKLFAMYDSGLFSYFSQRDTIGINGLIGDETLMRMALAHDFTGMLERFHVDYLVTYVPANMEIPPAAIVRELPASAVSGYHSGHRLMILDRRHFGPYVE